MEINLRQLINTEFNQSYYSEHFNDALNNKNLFKMETLLDDMLYIPSNKDIERIQSLKLNALPEHYTYGTNCRDAYDCQIDTVKTMALNNQKLELNPNNFFLQQLDLKNFNRAFKLIEYIEPTPEFLLELKDIRNQTNLYLDQVKNKKIDFLEKIDPAFYGVPVNEINPDPTFPPLTPLSEQQQNTLNPINNSISNLKIESNILTDLLFFANEKAFVTSLEKRDFGTMENLFKNGFVADMPMYEKYGLLKSYDPLEKEIIETLSTARIIGQKSEPQPLFDNFINYHDPVKTHENNMNI